MKHIRKLIECPACKGTGLYSDFAEGAGVAVICIQCNGSGSYKYSYSYKDFTGIKKINDIKRVYQKGTGYKIGLGKIILSGVGEIDMDKEGVSYEEFLAGKRPSFIERLACPLRADQPSCHKIPGFVDTCNHLNGAWITDISKCKNRHNIKECWKRFHKGGE